MARAQIIHEARYFLNHRPDLTIAKTSCARRTGLRLDRVDSSFVRAPRQRAATAWYTSCLPERNRHESSVLLRPSVVAHSALSVLRLFIVLNSPIRSYWPALVLRT